MTCGFVEYTKDALLAHKLRGLTSSIVHSMQC